MRRERQGLGKGDKTLRTKQFGIESIASKHASRLNVQRHQVPKFASVYVGTLFSKHSSFL